MLVLVEIMHLARSRSAPNSGTGSRTGFLRMVEPPAAYADAMRRTSQLAVDISTALADAGLEISARRLEGWTLDRLGPDESIPIIEQVAHYGALAKVAGPGRGRSADVAALRLAAHGFACQRLKGALLRAFNIAEVGQPEVLLDFSTEESTDDAFEQLEEIARGMAESIEQIPLPLRRVVEKLRRNVDQGASEMGESGEDVFRSAIMNFLCPLLGGEIYDRRPIAAMFGVDPAQFEPEAMEFVAEWLRFTTWELDEAYRNAPPNHVAILAQWLRERAHLVVSLFGLDSAPESQLDELAAMVAPYALHVLTVISTRFEDAEQFVAALELPAALTIPRIPAPPLSA
jgi:hypothetical protein